MGELQQGRVRVNACAYMEEEVAVAIRLRKSKAREKGYPQLFGGRNREHLGLRNRLRPRGPRCPKRELRKTRFASLKAPPAYCFELSFSASQLLKAVGSPQVEAVAGCEKSGPSSDARNSNREWPSAAAERWQVAAV